VNAGAATATVAANDADAAVGAAASVTAGTAEGAAAAVSDAPPLGLLRALLPAEVRRMASRPWSAMKNDPYETTGLSDAALDAQTQR